MSTDKTVRQQVGDIMGQSIPKGGYDMVFRSLAPYGKPDLKDLTQMMLIVLKHIDEYEQ